MTQPDMQAILQQAQEMQLQLQRAQKEILATDISGTAGGGLVTITMTGGGEVKDVQISPEVVDPEDVDTLQDLIAGAFADAHAKVGQLAEQKMGPLSQGLGGGLGGMLG
ncbi:YbaB/EbfC family nucleoid-associated protein [Corynebacterium sp. zg-331]|uniref:YbaB/EbfC family nucleoid-associated protein n=1 Tax=unclassified Corynebacterium TaxID=2624378 RepID=UPI00128BCB1B|nr:MULTISPECIES: YbaB/EbfC family nucleoid-associated protein [unclassified Corynebacterium]MBC3185759.1 YbaB/EbfC family nucleoid-associated protein [Corynebacterium sp. zg-331]MPV52252.1 YbaB/EbfC family nucleoid-associated protein [Corynebacterium sp. zg331]